MVMLRHPQTAHRPANTLPAPSAEPISVLMIEDDADMQELVSSCIGLSWPRASIIAASSGRKGLGLAVAEPPDLVILDVGLPDITGYEVLRRLRDFSDAAVVMLTGHSQEGDIERFLSEGALADDYVLKPFAPADLISRVQAAIRGSPASKHTARQDISRPPDVELEHLYEGTVRVKVRTQKQMGQMVLLLRQVHRQPELRLLKLGYGPNGSVDLRLRLRQPVSLRDILGKMEGVADVSLAQGPAPLAGGEEPQLTLTLATTSPLVAAPPAP